MRGVWLLATILLTAGCAEAPSTPAAATERVDPLGPEAVSETEGAVDGLVTDDSLVPLEGVNATLTEPGLNTTSDADGRFVFRNVLAGTYTLLLDRQGFLARSERIDVPAGEIVPLTLFLVATASEDPYHLTGHVSGNMNCGVSWRVATATAFDNTCSKTEDTPAYAIVDQSNLRINLVAQNFSALKTIVLETTWQPAQVAATALAVNYRTYYTSVAGGNLPTASRLVGDTQGKSPLKLVVNATRIQEIGTGPPLPDCQTYGPCSFKARTFPFASTLGPGSTVDFSLYLQQRFEHVYTEFFGAPAPEDFTAISPT